MSALLEDLYPDGIAALRTLFGKERVRERLPRLNAIHEYTEACWRDYVGRLPQRRVAYLLIAEAPPWSPEGRPPYVLDPASTPRTLLRALRSAFGLPSHRGVEPSSTLAHLAERGFLLLDSIPFAMDYTSRRGRRAYEALVGSTFETYLQAKIAASGLEWSQALKIAFSVQANAAAILRSAVELNTGAARFSLTHSMIAVNEAHYPDGEGLRERFGLAPNEAD